MECKLRLIIVCGVFFCLSLVSVAPASSVIKTLYVDGNLIGDVNQTRNMLKFTVDYLKVGAENSDIWSTNEYVGDMAEFAIYEGVLSAEDVNLHFQASDSNENYVAAVEADEPLLWLRFQDASINNGDIAKNSGSEDINGVYTVIGSGNFSQITGLWPDTNALVFPTSQLDADGVFVMVSDPEGEISSGLDDGAGGVDVSIELWVRFVNVNSAGPDNGTPRFFSHNGHWSARSGYAVMVNEDDPCQLGLAGGNETDYMAVPAPVNDGEWHHIVVTYDSTFVPVPAGSYRKEVKRDDPVLYIDFNEFPFEDDSNNDYWVDSSPQVEFHTDVKAIGALGGGAAWLGGGWIAAAPQTYEPCLPTDFSHSYEWSPGDITIEFWLATPEPGLVDGYAEILTDVNTLMMLEDDPDQASPYRPYAARSEKQGRMSLGDADLSDPMAYTSADTWKENIKWHHHVLIWDEQYQDSNQIWVEWYRDTVSCKNQAYSTDGTGYAVHGGPEMDHFLFGGYGSRDNFSPGVGVPYQQYVDELAIYPYVLSESRVEAHYNAWEPKDCADVWRRKTLPLVPTKYTIITDARIEYKLDVDRNCIINLHDFARFTQDWALCNDPGGGAGCSPNW